MAQIELNKRDLNKLVGQYKKGSSLAALAENFGLAVPTVRRLLQDARVKIRPRGRPAQA